MNYRISCLNWRVHILVQYLHWILDFAIIANINTVSGEVKVAVNRASTCSGSDIRLYLLFRHFDVLWQACHFEYGVFLATGGYDVRVRFILDSLDRRSTRSNHQANDFVWNSHLETHVNFTYFYIRTLTVTVPCSDPRAPCAATIEPTLERWARMTVKCSAASRISAAAMATSSARPEQAYLSKSLRERKRLLNRNDQCKWRRIEIQLRLPIFIITCYYKLRFLSTTRCLDISVCLLSKNSNFTAWTSISDWFTDRRQSWALVYLAFRRFQPRALKLVLWLSPLCSGTSSGARVEKDRRRFRSFYFHQPGQAHAFPALVASLCLRHFLDP